jgi:thymidine kinase
MLAPGETELAIGCMFSGKTNYLLGVAEMLRQLGIGFTLIKHSIDTRDPDGIVASHNGAKCSATIVADKLIGLKIATPWVLIDEGQFFEDLCPFCDLMKRKSKRTLVTCLNADFNLKMFPSIVATLPLADKITKLSAVCFRCRRRPASINVLREKKAGEGPVGNIKIGGAETYESICSVCHYGSDQESADM